MEAQNPGQLRFVVQYVHSTSAAECHYRLVAYGDGPALQPAKFSSLELLLDALLDALEAAAPLNAGSLHIRPSPSESYILFAGDLPISAPQLEKLGLAEPVPGRAAPPGAS